MKLTESAIKKAGELIDIEQLNFPDKRLFLRIAVQPGGCSGLRYQIYFDHEVKSDELVRYKALDVRVDKMSWVYLEGATMDFKDTINSQGFTIDNPNAKGSCACGESFQ